MPTNVNSHCCNVSTFPSREKKAADVNNQENEEAFGRAKKVYGILFLPF